MLIHHEDSIVFSMAARSADERTLVVERRNLAGEVLWSRIDIPSQSEGFVLARGGPIGVSGGAVAMLASPPYVDYGADYPITLDLTSGATIWSRDDNLDPLRMIVDDEQIFLAWTAGPRYDADEVEIERSSSSLGRIGPSGEILSQSDVEWPKGWRRWPERDVALAWMGERVVTVIEGSGRLGVTVHAKDGTLECQGLVDVEFNRIAGRASGIAGREQWLVPVQSGDPYTESVEFATLLLEPL